MTAPTAFTPSAAYVALRQGGAPAWRAGTELGLNHNVALELEKAFQSRRPGAGGTSPRFAKHDVHIKAVIGVGGYPVLEARR